MWRHAEAYGMGAETFRAQMANAYDQVKDVLVEDPWPVGAVKAVDGVPHWKRSTGKTEALKDMESNHLFHSLRLMVRRSEINELVDMGGGYIMGELSKRGFDISESYLKKIEHKTFAQFRKECREREA